MPLPPNWVHIYTVLLLSHKKGLILRLANFEFEFDFFYLLFSGKLKYLTLTDPDKVWMPDTFFRNEKVGHFHAILVNNVYVRVFPNGDVLFSIRCRGVKLKLEKRWKSN